MKKMIKEVIRKVPDRYTILLNGKLVMNGDQIAQFKVEDTGGSAMLVSDQLTIEIKNAYVMELNDDPNIGMFGERLDEPLTTDE